MAVEKENTTKEVGGGGMKKVFEKFHGKRVFILLDAYYRDDDGVEQIWEQVGTLYYEDGYIRFVSLGKEYYFNPLYVIGIREKEDDWDNRF